ncbi:NAD(P)/FAD-dependent oxidoreductase [Amycolatopsis sp. CA-230715]|uniref:NAD(P)/FAD-dependent oxidoreductase n=1 Tax=Amycolatopsis sp. CA-230715 TaxID=2745196 RepID=UPI001C034209|nr:NAD(P)/FAD-dependent oxidoreductase [Amycolatopsis sp. CA-230715]QWF85180.1 Thioredoxin reductase [Amycolatopsis sp. CA-230715]
MTSNSTPASFDIVVIGGGAAGLSGALTLGRARRSVLVIDAGEPRNSPAAHAHNYLGREGVAPRELLAIGREEVARYGVAVRDGRVTGAERDADGFRVHVADGTSVTARRLLVATGLVDELPPVPGLAERWGHDVLHCPYCHGWEVRDQAIGVLASGPLSVHQALLWRQWSEDVTLFLNDAFEPGDDDRGQLLARGITIVAGAVGHLESKEDELTGVALADGRVVACRALVVAPKFAARAEPLAALGLTTAEQERAGTVVGTAVGTVDPTGRTEVPGVWVAGNVTDLFDTVATAVAAGTRAAAAINADLVAEDTRMAVEAR